MLDKLRERARRWRSVYLVLAFGLVFVFGLGIRPEWVYAHVSVTLSAGVTLGYELLYGDSAPTQRIWVVAASIGAVIITLIRIYALSVYPTHIVVDEPWDLGWAMSYVHTGRFFDPLMYFGSFDIQRFMLPVAWWISIVGVGFWQVRLFFFLLIFPLIALTMLIARNWSLSALVTALIMFSSVIVMSAARIRHDIGLALALAASLWLFSEAEKRHKLILHFFAGLMIGLGMFAHYHAVLFGVALTISLYAPDVFARWRKRRWLPPSSLWAYIAGGLLGALLVFLLQILPDWDSFLQGRQPRSPASLIQFAENFLEHWATFISYSRLEFILLIAALAAALWRRGRIDIRLALLVITLHIALALQANEPYVYYIVPITPVYALVIAALFTHGWSQRARKPLTASWVWAAFFVLANLGITLQTPLQHLRAGAPIQLPTPPAAVWIQQNVDPSQKVVAEHWYYLFLTDYQVISTISPNYAPDSIRLSPHEAVWDEIAPDVVVIDRNLSTCCVPPILSPEYLTSRGYEVVAEFPGERYPVFIYEKGAAND